jgi:hypothetical protein
LALKGVGPTPAAALEGSRPSKAYLLVLLINLLRHHTSNHIKRVIRTRRRGRGRRRRTCTARSGLPALGAWSGGSRSLGWDGAHREPQKRHWHSDLATRRAARSCDTAGAATRGLPGAGWRKATSRHFW